MKKIITTCAVALMLAAALSSFALADAETFYPVAVSRSEDGREAKKIYELTLEQDPSGIPRSDFEQGGCHYTLTDLLRQEQAEYDERDHTETVMLDSDSKDMESVLSLLPQEQDFVTEDGYAGTLALKLDTVRVEPSGYVYYNRDLTATRSYPNLLTQDTANIPKSIEDSGHELTLQSIDWRTDNTETVDGYAIGDRYTAVATYTGTAPSSYVKGYTVTADYAGTVSRVALNKVRYVAIYEGTPIAPEETTVPEKTVVDEAPVTEAAIPAQFPWGYVLIPLGVVALVGIGAIVAVSVKRRYESEDAGESEESEVEQK